MKGCGSVIIEIMWYLIYGILATLLVSIGHLVIAEKRGYKALDYWTNEENIKRERRYLSGAKYFKAIIIGILLWPVNLLYWRIYKVPEWYIKYERKQ